MLTSVAAIAQTTGVKSESIQEMLKRQRSELEKLRVQVQAVSVAIASLRTNGGEQKWIDALQEIFDSKKRELQVAENSLSDLRMRAEVDSRTGDMRLGPARESK